MQIVSIQFENVRNFTSATLELERERIVLVGRNNAGKTAALSLLDWVFNGLDLENLEFAERVHQSYKEILLPARNTAKRARRITLWIRIDDGRVRRSYETDENNIAQLRLKIGSESDFDVAAKLSRPTRSEGWDNDPKALQLLVRLRDAYSVIYVPSFRDASSDRFAKSLSSAFSEALGQKALATGKQGSQYSQYTEIKKMDTRLQKLAQELTEPVLRQLESGSPNGLLQSAKVTLDTSNQEIVRWMVSQLRIKLVTGTHDKHSVPTSAVGSGLQSVLDVALHSVGHDIDGLKRILMVEEPEAFLHPSAQRLMARQLLGTQVADHLIITTHSPIFVEEAGYAPLCLADRQSFHHPKAKDATRESIHTSLLRGSGAEMVFASSVLLVEGPGDAQFYEALRRRLALHDESGTMDTLFVVPVGSKTSFCPWVNLIKSFAVDQSQPPIRFLVVADGDGSSDMREVLRAEAGTVPAAVRPELEETKSRYSAIRSTQEGRRERAMAWRKAIKSANAALVKAERSVHFHDGDLESSMLSSIGPDTLKRFQAIAGTSTTDLEAFLRKLGSKGIDGKGSGNATKKPWIRSEFGRELPREELSINTLEILSRWMSPVMKKAQRDALLRKDW